MPLQPLALDKKALADIATEYGLGKLGPSSGPMAEWDSFPNELRFAALRFSVTRLCEFFEGEQDEQQRINADFRDYLDRLRVLRREKEGGMEGLLMAMATGYDYRKYQRVKSGEFEGEEEGAEEIEDLDEPIDDEDEAGYVAEEEAED